jgi:hypothetical protein
MGSCNKYFILSKKQATVLLACTPHYVANHVYLQILIKLTPSLQQQLP